VSSDLTWFKPTETQENFIRTGPPTREVVYAGGIGSGKTLSGGFKALMASLNYPGTVGLVGRQTYRALEDTTKKVMLDGDDKPPIFPKELIQHRDDRENRVILKNGSEILFRSLEDWNTEKIRSLNLGWAYVDECTVSTLKIWLELVGRLRHPAGPGQVWGTTNPNGHDWVWKRFHPDAGVCAGPMFHQPTHGNPYLPPGYLEHLRLMPKEWYKRMVDGSFDTAAGAIWDMWDRNVHVIDAQIVKSFPVRWWKGRGMDHGRRNPTAVEWFLTDNDGFLVVGAEHYEEGLLPSQHAPIIRAKDEMVAPGINFGPIIAPPDCFRLDQNGNSVADEYMSSAGLVLTLANDNVDAGLLRVAEWLNRDATIAFPEWHPWGGTLGPDGKGSPRLFVSSDCKALIEEIPEYVWRDLQPSQEEKQNAPEEPRKLKDHACDQMRYWLMSRARPFSERAPQNPDVVRPQAVTAGLMDQVF
jgi:hypothetical protein